jgi:hypothetical protein
MLTGHGGVVSDCKIQGEMVSEINRFLLTECKAEMNFVSALFFLIHTHNLQDYNGTGFARNLN